MGMYLFGDETLSLVDLLSLTLNPLLLLLDFELERTEPASDAVLRVSNKVLTS